MGLSKAKQAEAFERKRAKRAGEHETLRAKENLVLTALARHWHEALVTEDLERADAYAMGMERVRRGSSKKALDSVNEGEAPERPFTPPEGMTISEIKEAVDKGELVRWVNRAYRVTKDRHGQYHILCESNNHAIGLTSQDGLKLNGNPDQFYIER